MGEEWRRGWHPERIRPKALRREGARRRCRPGGARGRRCPLGHARLRRRARRGRPLARRPRRARGAAARARSVDPGRRLPQAASSSGSRNVEVAFESRLTRGRDPRLRLRPRRRRDRRALATATASGRWHPGARVRPPDAAGAHARRPDGRRATPRAARVVIFDDDHYYMGGVLAELLASEGHEVTLVTPAARVSPIGPRTRWSRSASSGGCSSSASTVRGRRDPRPRRPGRGHDRLHLHRARARARLRHGRDRDAAHARTTALAELVTRAGAEWDGCGDPHRRGRSATR